MVPRGFTSWADYGHFSFAREYVTQAGEPYAYDRNWLETIGHAMAWPVLQPANFIAREIQNPLVILALTVSAIALATIAFYPTQFFGALSTIAPFLSKFHPWMAKFALFLCIEITIAGIGLRTLGRVTNDDLMLAWTNREIRPLHIGAVAVQSR